MIYDFGDAEALRLMRAFYKIRDPEARRIILAVAINLFIGLATTAALGLMMVGALNLISVAFAVLFVGLGVDFGIQFAVRYRAERHEVDDLRVALIQAGKTVGAPLTLAAAAVAAGFMSFLPTDYRGVSELGQIAGAGMLVHRGEPVFRDRAQGAAAPRQSDDAGTIRRRQIGAKIMAVRC